jgi:DNA-binding NtrC family response regulator
MSTMTLVRMERSIAFCAEVQDDDGARVVPLACGRFEVGSAAKSAIAIADKAVSSHHVTLDVDSERIIVRDAGSKNGTYVGALRVREASADAGTIITIGRSTITLRASCALDVQPKVEPLPGLLGSSMAMRRVAADVRRLAPWKQPVLVCGESGCGKELVAHALHMLSGRRTKPFVAINVTSVPRELVESEFFGHEKGSFTGAHARRRGAFEEAEGGTLFLDEIGDLPIEAQPKLLRALDGYAIRSVGANGDATRDVRLVAATHAPLRKRVEEGAFRRDLFHRLEVFTINVPPLRERRGDVGPIARAVLRSIEHDVGPKSLSSAAIARLAAEPWPGNVRELRNAVLRAASIAPRETIDAIDIERAISPDARVIETMTARTLSPQLAKTLVRDHRGNVSAAARAVGMSRSTFRKLLMR